ncbi:MAG: UvrD-helicase domain-containing protein [Gammaproteobacteria bacterium]
MRTVIAGPPGTGKTHTLVNTYLRKELFLHRTDPKKICYITFSNAAAKEARERIQKEYPNKEIEWISTMHSMGTKMLGIDTTTQLLKDKNWNAFKNKYGHNDMHFETIEKENGYHEYKNQYMKIIEYSRCRKIKLQDAAIELDLIDYISEPLLIQINEDIINYKKDYSMYEFSDMISEFVKKSKCPSLDAVFLDEAQDLNPLQWEMFFYIESICKRSFVAGDDDQAIYTFQGADPKTFINLTGTSDHQTQSRRVPKAIHKVALSILENIDERREKEWKPREAEGSVFENLELEDLHLDSGQWMVLTRTNEQLKKLVPFFQESGYRFDCKFNDLLPPEIIKAINDWNRLNKGASISGEEAQNIYEFLKYEKGDVQYGFSGGKSLENVDSVTIDELKLNHGLKVSGGWDVLRFKDYQKDYIKELMTSGEDLSKPARIKLSTIHSVKGEESENVVLFTDLERIIYESAQVNKDTEHRLFFVGVTRAKENLFIMNQGYEYQYNIGEEII